MKQLSAQLKTMLSMQDTLNKKVHPQWEKQGFRWARAVMVEAVEALDHYGWKWWKKQEPDLPQVYIELVDIWHFILSDYIERYGVEDAAQILDVQFCSLMPSQFLLELGVQRNFDLLISEAGTNHINLAVFQTLVYSTGLSWDALYATYIAKNVLNTFRQDNGYKAGTYIKMWRGQEDNVCLENLMAGKPDATPEQLTAKLGQIYASVKAAA